MTALFANNASSRTPVDIAAGETSLLVMPGEGARFPSPGEGDYCMVTIEDRRTGQIEICRCTARNGDTLTVERARESTAAQSFALGATISNRLTAGTILNFAGVPEAPEDGKIYARQDEAWVETITKAAYDAQLIVQDTRDDGQDNSIYNNNMSIVALEGDITRIDGVNDDQDAAIVALGGDITRIDLEQDAQDVSITANTAKNVEQDDRLDAVEDKNSSQDLAIAGKVGEAPEDGITYGRKDATWVPSVGGAVVSESSPAGPIISGQLWWENDSGNLFVYYDDGNSKQWVQVASVSSGGGGGGGGSGVPVGSIVDFAGSTAPPSWMLCYGQIMSRVLYPKLFQEIGTDYGAGDGSTTFNLPDCRGRVSAGKDDMGGTSANRLTLFNGDLLGAVGGSQGVTLTIAQIPSHNHGGATGLDSNNHTHSLSVTGNTGYISVDHAHNFNVNTGGENTDHAHTVYGRVRENSTSATDNTRVSLSGQNTPSDVGTSGRNAGHLHNVAGGTGGVTANHYHGGTFTGTSGGVSAWHSHTVTAQGGGTEHSSLQPTIVFNKMIKVV